MYVVIILYIFIHIGKRIYKYLSIGYDFNKFWRVGIFILSTKFQCETMRSILLDKYVGRDIIFFFAKYNTDLNATYRPNKRHKQYL